ncbi:MAG: UDP-N-acetylenolpyruvoylglucosamine reductase [Bacteroidetes bacterium]|nr:MAG: UDP-N-acetylenolpyruvoylglucosamine reductase [Bacteroidota bacterium]
MVKDQIIAIFTIMIDIHHKHPLKDLNSFGLDTRASSYAKPENLQALCEVLAYPDHKEMPLLVLGEGSNILFREDFDGLVLQPGMKGIEVVEEKGNELVVKVGASENWDSWVAHAIEKGWYGLENLSLIPGSVGSAPVQNIGAYGVELKDRFEWVEAWDLHEKQLVRLDHKACAFGYRSSIFKGEEKGRYIITHVAFRLNSKPDLQLDYGMVKKEFTKAKGSTPQDLRKVIIAIRSAKLPDPEQYGNAGSFFKNPLVDRTIFSCIRVEYPDVPFYPDAGNQMKIPAAWLIEKSGWKGKRIGNVGTWPSQPLVLVNYDGATGQEIYDFSQKILEDVDRIFGVILEREVNVI